MKLIQLLIIAVCMLVCIFEAYSFGGKKEEGAVQLFNGEISYTEGTVLLNGIKAEIGDSVTNGDNIITEADSVCEVVFNERNIIQIGADSLFSIGSSSSIDFSLEKGSLAAVADKLNKIAAMKERLVVKTPSAVMGIRGTLFFIKVEDENSSYLCVCRGKANTYNGEGKSRKLIEADHHKATRFIRSGGSFKRESAGLLYHDDASMEKLAEKIGIDVEWGSGKAY